MAIRLRAKHPSRSGPGELLQHWLQVRAEARILGTFLFPSTRSGKPWVKESKYKAAKQVLQEARLDASDGGSFRLRHTFALRQLRHRTDSDQAARRLTSNQRPWQIPLP